MNLLRLFSRSRSEGKSSHVGAHMTWGSTSVGRSISRTTLFLKKQLWVWPIIAFVLLSTLGFFVNQAIESTMKENLRSELETLLNIQSSMLEKWLDAQAANAQIAANDARVRTQAQILLTLEDETETEETKVDPKVVAEARRELAKGMSPFLSSSGFVGFHIFDRNKRVVASSQPALVGEKDLKVYDVFLDRALKGESLVSTPFPSISMLPDNLGQMRTGVPTMWACAPIRDASFQVTGVLALRLRPELEFTDILQSGRRGHTGESYAFDKRGMMVSNSRFDQELVLIGILPDREGAQSILNVHVRDPQVNMMTGQRLTKRRGEMPLTRMAAAAIAGTPGVDVDGYRDYRGVPTVGAWTWLPRYEMGVAVEVGYAEAFRPLTILRRTVWGLYGMLIMSAAAIFIFSVVVARLNREARKAVIEAQQLGQYTLEEKLGAGAMGVVYRGHHAMLRRPTAIKLLDADSVSDASIERFEREVQITCRLNHPSTIAIYDYGRTPEGVFYYAMEYLDGVNLQTLVERYGAQPPGRVVAVLLQVCGSLYEAHSQGLVHRDIKPANIMVNRRGGVPDVVKVLDFGLVKSVEEGDEDERGRTEGLTGTPLYMSPEAIQTPLSVDGRSDLYSVGAVGYFLLTGKPVFDATNLAQLCQKHVDETPVPPSQQLGKGISEELEHAILACLEKSRAKRPQTARDLAELFKRCPEANAWSLEEAEAWWSRHERGQTAAEPSRSSQPATRSGYDQTLAHG